MTDAAVNPRVESDMEIVVAGALTLIAAGILFIIIQMIRRTPR